MINERLKKDFPKNKFKIKKVEDNYIILMDGKDLKIGWKTDKKDGQLDQREEDILYKHIMYRVQDRLASTKYGDTNGKERQKITK